MVALDKWTVADSQFANTQLQMTVSLQLLYDIQIYLSRNLVKDKHAVLYFLFDTKVEHFQLASSNKISTWW